MRVIRISAACCLTGALLALHPAIAVESAPSELAEVTVLGWRDADGPGLAPEGSNRYSTSSTDIAALPSGSRAGLSDVLAQMPGVAIDQNQQIHIRNTEGPQFQYQIDGVMVPLDINTNPSFLSLISPQFLQSMNLLTGILPANFSYATGGVVEMHTRDACTAPIHELSLVAGQRSTLQPEIQWSGCGNAVNWYVDAQASSSQTAFSSATPGPSAYHDGQQLGQLFAKMAGTVDGEHHWFAIVSTNASNNQLPNVPNLPATYTLAGIVAPPSARIRSTLDFRDALAMLSLSGPLGDQIQYQASYSFHTLEESFHPDVAGELAYQGVASATTHTDVDHTLQLTLGGDSGSHHWSSGLYMSSYHVAVDGQSTVLPLDPNSGVVGTTPLYVGTHERAGNVLAGAYINDLWSFAAHWHINVGLRVDSLTGLTTNHQVDPTINVVYQPGASDAFHLGIARYFQVPGFQGITAGAQAAFANTTAAGPPGSASPLTEDDLEMDGGWSHHFTQALSLSTDLFYERTHHYLDTGQFGVVPLFAPFNYDRGHIWGGEIALAYHDTHTSAWANLTLGDNMQRGVDSGQYNFPADELQYINAHAITLDHQPRTGISAGTTWQHGPNRFSVDGLYSSGLRGGFADLTPLPEIVQVNVGLSHSFLQAGSHTVQLGVSVLNIFDRINLIRPADGIGIFQAAYEPRRTFYASAAMRF